MRSSARPCAARAPCSCPLPVRKSGPGSMPPYWCSSLTARESRHPGPTGSHEARSMRAAAPRGEWWRAVTALTLHLDQAHLLGNLLFGVAIGFLAGRAFGPGIAWASILAAAAVANYADMLISPSTHRAVGASTAVFAALGLLVGFAWRHGLTLRERFNYAYAPAVRRRGAARPPRRRRSARRRAGPRARLYLRRRDRLALLPPRHSAQPRPRCAGRGRDRGARARRARLGPRAAPLAAPASPGGCAVRNAPRLQLRRAWRASREFPRATLPRGAGAVVRPPAQEAVSSSG